MYKLNDLVDLLVFPIDTVGKTTVMVYEHINALKEILTSINIFPEHLYIQNIAYYNNKRGFVVTLSDKRRYFVRPIIKKDVNLIYIGRRLVGQPHCCAKAHAVSAGLALSFKNINKFKVLEYSNLIPCNTCFELSEHEYLVKVKQEQNPLLANINSGNVNLIFAAALVYLMQGDRDNLTDVPDIEEINKAFFIKSIESTIRSLTNVNTEGQAILDKAYDIVDPISVTLVQQIENIVTSSLRLASTMCETEVDSLSINDCYELAETMAQLRTNLGNLVFALKYKGELNGAF